MERIAEIEKLAKDYGEVLDQIDIFEKLKETIRQTILLKFEQNFGHEGYTYNTETGGKLQRILQVRTDADTDAVKKVLTYDQWEKVRKETVDVTKLKAAIGLGIINPVLVNGALKTVEIDKVMYKA
jgi:hypothetical protein